MVEEHTGSGRARVTTPGDIEARAPGVRPPRRRIAALGLRYGGACLAVAVALLAWMTLSEHVRLPPFVLLYPMVTLVALLGGLGPGLFATALSAFSAAQWILPSGWLGSSAWQGQSTIARDVVALALFTAGSIFICLVAHLYKVARRRLAEREARLAMEDQFVRVAASVPGLIFSYRLRPDGGACLPFTTPAVEDLYGIPQAALAKDSSPLMANVHPDDLAAVNEAQAESARDLSRLHEAFRYLHPTKGLRWIDVWAVPNAEPDGGVLWHGFAMDVTDRKHMEEALRLSDRRKSEFLGILSHELRNPLAPIRNGIYVLNHVPAGSPAAARAKEIMERQAAHLARIVDDLLDVTRVSRGKIKLDRRLLDLREVVQRTCEDHRSMFEQAKVELRHHLPASPTWIDGDATRISQVLGNLLQNAAKFTSPPGTVTVEVASRDGSAEMSVRDSGVGMKPEEVEHMLEPFAQAEQSLARPQGGLGLGLAISKGLVELHGGSLQARSDGPGRGSEFCVRVPLAPAPAPVASAPAPAPAAASAPAPVPEKPDGGRLVLLIDDNAATCESLSVARGLTGHVVRTAQDGRTGIAMAHALGPDVVLCDIGLPDIDGYEVARRLRADEALRSTRLIALSGYARPEDKACAREAGFDAHVTKPPDLDELNAVLAGSGGRT